MPLTRTDNGRLEARVANAIIARLWRTEIGNNDHWPFVYAHNVMSRRGRHLLAFLVLVAFAARFKGLFENTFAADEALFASWAKLIAGWRDPLLLDQWVDKPPLLFYLQAVCYPLLGPGELAARVPNFVASILLIPLSSLLAWRLFANELMAALTGAFVAFSPLAIQFSATAYTDPLMTTLITASFLAAIADGLPSMKAKQPRLRSALVSGLLFGLAILTKYQAWLFLPLIAGIALINGWDRRKWFRWAIGLSAIVLLLLAWDIFRTGRPSLVTAQLNAYGGLRLAWSWELWPRLEAWGEIWGYLIDAPVLGFAILLAFPPFLALLIYEQDRATAIDQLLVVFLAAYFVLHWFIAIPIWDRYVLPIVPIVGLILTRFAWRLVKFSLSALPPIENTQLIHRTVLWLLPFSLLAFQGPSVLEARTGKLPVGGRPDADHGASKLAAELADAGYGTVLYDYWYSWQWRYHLFDSRVYISWQPDLSSFARDLAVFGKSEAPRFLVVTDGDAAIPFERTVRQAGFDLILVERFLPSDHGPGMELYRIAAPPG